MGDSYKDWCEVCGEKFLGLGRICANCRDFAIYEAKMAKGEYVTLEQIKESRGSDYPEKRCEICGNQILFDSSISRICGKCTERIIEKAEEDRAYQRS